jgi:two-component system, NtrC family, response regulator GlrR
MASAAADIPVHVSGPAGSGKQHIARAIHAWSSRTGGPFVVLAGAALAEPLVARELYGCVQGLYPTLPEAYDGALSRASGGTLLIERIDRLPGSVHREIPKILAEGRFQREGDARFTPLRARIVTTSLDPIERSPFGDLPHHTLALRPLAERSDDIPPLAAHFLRMYAEEAGIEAVGFTSEARNALLTEPWPGNVRELAERIRQALRLAGNGAVSAEALLLSTDAEEIPSFKEAKRAFETRYVVGLLRRCGGNISRAARLAKKDRKDFYDVIRRTGVDPSEFR